MTKQASRILNVPRKPESGRRLIVISGGFEPYNHGPVPITSNVKVSQIRLARIKERQSRIAFELKQLKIEWDSVRSDLLKGATIEDGPIRAWLEYSFAVARGQRKKTRTRLRVY